MNSFCSEEGLSSAIQIPSHLLSDTLSDQIDCSYLKDFVQYEKCLLGIRVCRRDVTKTDYI